MPINYESRISGESKMRTPDRILTLAVIDGKKPRSSMGMTDQSLFQEDGNKLHAVMDLQTSLWHLKYEKGDLPPPLKGQFTSFAKLKTHAENYFVLRNIKITEVSI